MAFALKCQANLNYFDLGVKVESESLRVLEECGDNLLEEVPEEIRHIMRRRKPVWKAFAKLFGHVADYLRLGTLPNNDNVLNFTQAGLPGESALFFNAGDTVAAAVYANFDGIVAQSTNSRDEEHGRAQSAPIARLPAYRNDSEYKMARKGYKDLEGPQSRKWWRDMANH